MLRSGCARAVTENAVLVVALACLVQAATATVSAPGTVVA
jgi:hypothetical protein